MASFSLLVSWSALPQSIWDDLKCIALFSEKVAREFPWGNPRWLGGGSSANGGTCPPGMSISWGEDPPIPTAVSQLSARSTVSLKISPTFCSIVIDSVASVSTRLACSVGVSTVGELRDDDVGVKRGEEHGVELVDSRMGTFSAAQRPGRLRMKLRTLRRASPGSPEPAYRPTMSTTLRSVATTSFLMVAKKLEVAEKVATAVEDEGPDKEAM